MTDVAQLKGLLPQVDAVLGSPALARTLEVYRRAVVLRQVRLELDSRRAQLLANGSVPAPATADAIAQAVVARVDGLDAELLKPVINGTGVLLHTNLGRSVLGARAVKAVQQAADGYSDLEIDMATGTRSKRDAGLEKLVCALTGAEAATVVNNCAAALLLILNTLAKRRDVITSRGELVEIGGGFRVPEVVKASGCRLVEVGTTNRTRLADYAETIGERTALLLKTHQSNFRIRGFTEEAPLAELVHLGREHSLPVVFDAGSGYFTDEYEVGSNGAAHGVSVLDEPDIEGAVRTGASLVCFSGDKLFGGPQAGIICGDAELVAPLRKNPLWRALRMDKLTIAALGATLAEKLRRPERRGSGGLDLQLQQVPRQRNKAEQLLQMLQHAQPDWQFELVELEGSFGGGSCPDQTIPGWAVSIQSRLSAPELDQRLRLMTPAILGLKHKGAYCLHVGALLPGDAESIAARVKEL